MKLVARSLLAASLVGARPGVASAQTAPAAAPSRPSLVHLQPELNAVWPEGAMLAPTSP